MGPRHPAALPCWTTLLRQMLPGRKAYPSFRLNCPLSSPLGPFRRRRLSPPAGRTGPDCFATGTAQGPSSSCSHGASPPLRGLPRSSPRLRRRA